MLGQAKIAMGVLATLLLSAAPVFAQHAVGRQIRPPKLPQKQAQQEQKQSARESERAVKNHAGDWLRRYKDLPPDQQRQALENDAPFEGGMIGNIVARRQRPFFLRRVPGNGRLV